jgi:hypothetical protein
MPEWEKYGFSRNDPDFWLRTTRAILDDGALTTEDKYALIAKFIDAYKAERDDKTARNLSKAGHTGNKDVNNEAIKEAEERHKGYLNPNFKQ